MSAYALPGLFPPIDKVSEAKEVNEPDGSFSDGGNEGDSSCANAHESSSDKNMPLHHQKGNCSNYSTLYGGDCGNSSPSSSNIGCLLSSAAIAVKEAKIDPIRWIQFVTGSYPQQYAKQIGKTLRRRVSGSSGSSQLSPVGRTASIRTRRDPSKGSKHCTSSSNSISNNKKSPQNEAIEFELAITLNGRRYTAKRTMQCIVQLRDDLIREMKRRREWLTESQAMPSLQLPYESNVHSFYTTPPHSISTPITTKPEPTKKHCYAVSIPEIPPLSGCDDRDIGIVGRGFTMLHQMVTSYVPVMESWLKNVMEIVPQDSECLMNFLWEPATEIPSDTCKSVSDSINNNNLTGTLNKFKPSSSMATLCSIKEMDYDMEDDDSDDEDAAFSDKWKN